MKHLLYFFIPLLDQSVTPALVCRKLSLRLIYLTRLPTYLTASVGFSACRLIFNNIKKVFLIDKEMIRQPILNTRV